MLYVDEPYRCIYSQIGHGFGLGHWDERVNS